MIALRAFALVLAALMPVACANAAGRLIAATPHTYLDQVAALKPGDTLQLAPGEYRDGLRIHRLAGTAAAPIVIRGPTAAPAAVFIARPGENTVSIIDAAYIDIRDLTLDGRGIAVDAVKAEGHARWAHHITLENLTIINHGANQQIVGISTKTPVWGWIIRRNRIHAAGTGMYLGNSDGSAPFYDGLIEHNVVTDPLGYAIQIKHQNARPALRNAPRGRYVTVIRHNVLSKGAGGSPAPLARPNLLLGHWPLSGEGSKDEYQVYGNFISDNPHEALVQAEGHVALYNNVLRNASGSGIHIQPHNDVPRHIRILFNTIITSGSPIAVRLPEGPSAYAQVIAGNAIFSARSIVGASSGRNALYGYDEANDLLGAILDGRAFDPYPRDERLRCEPIDSRLLVGLADAACDFNGSPRTAAYCGAYAGHGTNPGWVLTLAAKPNTPCNK